MNHVKPVAALSAAGLAGLSVGVFVTVAFAGWTGAKPVMVVKAAPAWVGTAETLHFLAAGGAAICVLAWIALDYRER